MSKNDQKPTRAKTTGPDGAFTVGPFTLAGMVRTTRGYAVAISTFAADGSLISTTLGNSQVAPYGKPFIAAEHVRLATALAAKL